MATEAKEVVDTIGSHYTRQATPEVWFEVDELRSRVTTLESALKLALSEVECSEDGLCQHWIHWHVVARRALGLQP